MTPFVILGMPRTGSSLLAYSLAEHSRIRVFGELFNQHYEERQANHIIRTEDNEPVFYRGGDEDAIEFLKKNLWSGDIVSQFDAIGFKLFAEKIECKGTEGLFKRLKHDIPNIHFIVIERKNLLDVFVSRMKAEQSNIWVIPKESDYLHEEYLKSITPIHTDPRTLEDFFKSYERVFDFYRDYFSDATSLFVNYSDLCTDFKNKIEQIFRFLDVSPIPLLTPTITKQNLSPHRDFFINYEEIRQYFLNTPYSAFFTEM